MESLLNAALRSAISATKNGGLPNPDVQMSPTELKDMRNKLEMSQAEFSAFLGVSLDTIKSWETGRRSPNKFIAPTLARVRSELEDA